jgi:cytochrome c1
MVNYHFNDGQIDDVIAFLDWCGNVDLNGFPAKPPLAEKMKATAAMPVVTTKPVPAIFDSMACTGCHAIGGKGGAAGVALGAPPLDEVYKRKTKEELKVWIADPQKIKPDTKMPKLPLSPEQVDEIADFLSNLGK